MKKLGIIDSGIGGLTLLKQLIKSNFDAEFWYISDENNVPYGEKSQVFMLSQMREMTKKLITQDVEGILIACNTATSETIDDLRSEFSLNFVGIEPYLNYINKEDVNPEKNIALILTQATFRSERFKKLKSEKDPNGIIDIYPQKNLAILIESLKSENFNSIKDEVLEELKFLKNKRYDHVILGCTHYPIISNFIETTYNTSTVDPAQNVANRFAQVLGLSEGKNKNNYFRYNPNNSNTWKTIHIEELSFLNS